MIYLALDNCVWLELLKARFSSLNNVFEELMFWLEKGEIKCITTDNLIREWDRHKENQVQTIVREERNRFGSIFRINEDMATSTDSDKLCLLLEERVQKVDTVLKSQSEIAPETNEIVLRAWEKNYKLLAPNHKKDSFRDTMNILCLLAYCKEKQYACLFTTKDGDYYENDRYKLHPNLAPDFKEAGVEYVYFDSDLTKNKLFNHHLRTHLSDYQLHLSELRKKEAVEQKQNTISVEVQDDEYLDSLHYIDDILAKRRLGKPDMKIIEMLINSHEGYKQYFLRKVGDNGLV